MNFKKIIGLIFVGYVITIFLVPYSNPVTSAEVRKIDLVTTPEKVLFDVTNMKPGDYAARTLKITNSGADDFNYLFNSDKKSGSEKLYNALHIIVSDEKGELYNGSLGEFKKLDPRALASQASEELVFTVEFPTHLGNEYQGLECEVELKFYVEGTMGGVLPVDGPKLPNTATNSFNLILIGFVLLGGGFILYRYLNKKKRDIKHA
ncbi:LPXTG cell wall anchor domain-containing protein [Mesobacillus maritimus]|uniref:LPXTG cell wall anchor domain-containing protein n=1 Tax=Mesobacillus maritimus TaxID=1643336 RepID=UPI00203CB6B6|nr:LPXTG cell wall anchor domain-containing protein [Mesobacillus maritimus]MCM3669756.1 LPXTG cell wall anchor domain-containing protein [Mesobacillus maritimus]